MGVPRELTRLTAGDVELSVKGDEVERASERKRGGGGRAKSLLNERVYSR